MALNGVLDVLYVIDILIYTIIDDGWEFGELEINTIVFQFIMSQMTFVNGI